MFQITAISGIEIDDQRASRVGLETGRRNDGEVEILPGLDHAADIVTTGGALFRRRRLSG
ncbi:hypothetical protein ABK249_17070 [Neorhizobium sp. Rsf11]|uniref:Uncharacterized protein n=1 Tax=Neorhizobium phenanthreniclasticum TaxID=3157917 RepID=A0ABV0M446_9HYPH